MIRIRSRNAYYLMSRMVIQQLPQMETDFKNVNSRYPLIVASNKKNRNILSLNTKVARSLIHASTTCPSYVTLEIVSTFSQK